ncbi:hypothetical protein EN829_000980 [Mesorhizobium sp. M00.F.Ca.ET.186.01.1.1]|nr:hypothetical protein EN848_09580 [bacterium M00.F.Ca.ET.205.01.1.1]TGU55791.1 hypothetical protein EN795_03445 [bacterium M00.F.Ca.ET.152.01.1.1]TGV39936.1 hypothetical protein EN829_000980 [Mesorhizobium sp. M00.F.Ca.ET.186.01.1.1]TGZ44918.1 hypothetical protein EN805_00975 [bacterium M00.F.Ca.ET.162.01.1.1]
MSETFQSFMGVVGIPTIGAIFFWGIGIFVRNLPFGVRILILVFAAVLSLPGLFALYLLAIFSSLGHT